MKIIFDSKVQTGWLLLPLLKYGYVRRELVCTLYLFIFILFITDEFDMALNSGFVLDADATPFDQDHLWHQVAAREL